MENGVAIQRLGNTPGPFTLRRMRKHFAIEAANGVRVAQIRYVGRPDGTTSEDVANLFVAAPDMLDALKAAEPLMTALCSVALKPEIDDYIPSGLKEQIAAWLRGNLDGKAIRKAEGGAQ